jgi:outer membrane protein assembly factor BamB
VDIYFDKTYRSRRVTDRDGDFARVLVRVPRSALPGAHTISAVEVDNGSSAIQNFVVQTDWPQLQFNSRHTGENPYENVLSPKTVGDLTPKWNLPSGKSFGPPAVADGIVHVGTNPNSTDWGPFYRLDAATGTPLGFFVAGAYYYAPPAAHGLVYMNTRAAVYALDAHTGDLVWSYEVEGNLNSADVSNLTAAEDMIYFTFLDRDITPAIALDARTGKKVWSYFGGIGKSQVTVANGVAYFCSSNQVDAVDARTGKFLWTFTAGGAIAGYPTVVKNVAYFSGGEGYVYAINASTGALIWKSAAGTPTAPPAVANGRVYIHSYDGNLFSFDARTGKLVWTYATSACNCYQFSPAVANGVVYFATDITVYALDARDGTLLWSYDTGGIYSPPVVADGVLYVGTETSGLWAFGLKDRSSAETDPFKPQPALVQPDRGAMGSSAAAGHWHETVIYSFSGGIFYCGDGEIPYAGLVFDSAGLLHGTTLVGLPNCGDYNEGSVFTVSTSGQERVG